MNSSSTSRSLVRVCGLSTSYGNKSVLQSIDLDLVGGKIISLLGPNGAGKSTLMKSIAGLLQTEAGLISGSIQDEDGKELLKMIPAERAKKIAYIPAEARIDFPVTVEEAVWMGRVTSSAGLFVQRSSAQKAAVESALQRCHCEALRSRELGTLSGGEKQLVLLARALAQGAKTLLVDESLSKMDLNHQYEVGRLLKALSREGYAILMVSHDLNLATEWADEVVLMKQGQILAQGQASHVVTIENLNQLYPGTPLMLSHHPKTGGPKIFFGSAE